MNFEFDLIIVGSGLSGLVAACESAKNGVKVLVVEAQGLSGGQIKSISLNSKFEQFGAEFLNNSHVLLCDEISRHSMQIENQVSSLIYWYFQEKEHFSLDDVFKSVVSSASFKCLIDILDKHASYIVLGRGFAQCDLDRFDIPFNMFLENLHVSCEVTEFVLMQIFQITGSNASLMSTVSVLYLIHALGGAETTFQLSFKMQRIVGGPSLLIEKYKMELESYGGRIEYGKPIIAAELIPLSGSHPVQKYDYPPNSPTDGGVKLTVATTGEVLTARAVLFAIPMNCIPSIRFTPKLPDALTMAGERCNIGTDYVKLYAAVTMVSHRMNRVFSYSTGCKEVRLVKYAHAKKTLSQPSSSQRQLEKEEEASIVCVTGWRHELLPHLENALREIHPQARLARVWKEEDFSRSLQEVNCRDNAILCHDFARNPYARSSWFSLRAGTALLHAQACREAKQPWGSDHPSLYFASADLSTYWPGWMEGAISAGREAAAHMYRYLYPDKIPRNFLRRVPNSSSNSNTYSATKKVS